MRCTLLCAAITLGAASQCLFYPENYNFGNNAPLYRSTIEFETTQEPKKFMEITPKQADSIVRDDAGKKEADSSMSITQADQEARNDLLATFQPITGCSNVLNRTRTAAMTTSCPEPEQNHLGESICQNGAVWDTVACECKQECDDASDVPDECNKPIDIAFVIDASGSIGASNYITMKEKIGQIVHGLDISANMVHVAAHAFSCSDCHLQTDAGFDFTDNVYGDTLVQNTIDALPFHSQNTYIGQAMRHTFHTVMNGGNAGNGFRGNGVPAAIIVITDGNPNPTAEGLVAKTAAQDARNKGIRVFAIGAGGYDSQNLKELACDNPNDTTCTDKFVYNTHDFDVSVFKEELLNVLCADVSTTTTTTKPQSDCGCKDPSDNFPCFEVLANGNHRCVERAYPNGPCPTGTQDCNCPDDDHMIIGPPCNSDDECISGPHHLGKLWRCLGGNKYYNPNPFAARTGDCVKTGCGPIIMNGGGTTTTAPDDNDNNGGGGGGCEMCAGMVDTYHCLESHNGHSWCAEGIVENGNPTGVCKPTQFDCIPHK